MSFNSSEQNDIDSIHISCKFKSFFICFYYIIKVFLVHFIFERFVNFCKYDRSKLKFISL